MKKGSIQQGNPCTPSEQMEKVIGVINGSEVSDLQRLVGEMFILTAKVTDFKKKNCCSPIYRDFVEGHIENILEKLESCIDEVMLAGNDVRFTKLITEIRDNAGAYLVQEEQEVSE